MIARSFRLGRAEVGPGHPAYIIAELSANHGQNFEEAVRLVRAAKESGADAVKLQTYTADTMTIPSNGPDFQIRGGTIWDGRNLHELYQDAYTPWEWQPKLKQVAESLGMDLFSTPFDPTAVDFLESMHVPAHKIASFEVVDLPLIEKIAATGKPIIMSTGMATLAEITEAVDTIFGAGNRQLVLLKCTSAYPAAPDTMNLRTIPHLAEAFGVPAGLSDHTLDIAVPVAAVVLGACVIEKHLTMSRSVPGPDSAFSLEPAEFRRMVEAVRAAEKAVGSVHYGVTADDAKSRVFRRSLYVVADIKSGEPFTEANVRSIRPGHGLPPKMIREVLGRRAATDLPKGTALRLDLILS
ncbi:pseudaminic acid synthase [Zavarzinella formosa]|uniref:pseudaminic acid synthase n=1 Tax=Zavarzinella formosa TaxID=360055 RepID=UPI0002F27E8B|nr:pseudaminic acid synthase [Zavarzinella formosa]